MKRSILLLFSFFACLISASAQMMPDSTVQVIAYWEVGDKYNYQVEDSKYKVKNGTDTTDVERAAHLLTLEIVDATNIQRWLADMKVPFAIGEKTTG